jgi:methylmalonyl-CoA mutase N-terminal domain/subunit
MRAGRSQSTVNQGLDELEAAARDGRNLMPPILAAAAAYTTVGEISDRLRSVFGEHRES